MSIYLLKSRFQDLLRPLVHRLHARGITANQVTVAACAISVALGVLLSAAAQVSWLFVLLPLWLFVRMALNAIDGMLAREFGQQSALGGYLNETTDVIADAALYLPFAFVAPFGGLQIGLLIWLAALSELCGVLGQVHGKSRRYDGPAGKSDRALVFGGLGLWYAQAGSLPPWLEWVMWLVVVLIACTAVRRVRRGLQAA
ncbi:CDP-diacylglycerol--glycerol-3-phosphate 3-phosphatidyltransferase [Neisseria sp. HSC-16F19]|nr:CDP-alcohol phosphatidyltransferase family protein [Neisseria sp. HSC-16F19]MCP2040228.1 CDP-diacylglycerol--glycerol-3-phosphate 3-phosphatidyltransferase [Neisseria sp. HSC-16F19]